MTVRQVELRQRQIFRAGDFEIIRPAFDQAGGKSRRFNGRRFVSNRQTTNQRRMQCVMQYAKAEHLRGQGVPE